MTRRFFVQGLGSVLAGWRYIGGQFVDVVTELQAAAIRGELDETEEFWAGGPVVEEMGPIKEHARFGPVVGVDGMVMPERARFV